MYLIEPKRDGKWIYDPGVSMAIQEYVKDHVFLDDDVLFPYMMQPAVQIGKYQNAYEEVNQPYMDEHDIRLIRRATGGGAIYMDDQNMSFCFLFNDTESLDRNYAALYEPAIQALKNLGIDETLLGQKGRNDLELDGKKISGAAMAIQNGRIYAGYSLLLDPNYEAMVEVLTPNQKKIQSHGIQSVRRRVGSIRPYLAEQYRDMTVWDFTDYMICQLLGIDDVSEAKRYEFTAEDWDGIDKIAAEKYNNWDWNYGHFKQFEYRLTERFPIGTMTLGLTIEHAKIAQLQITGDFFGSKDVHDLEQLLIGTRLRKDDLLKQLENVDLTAYFGQLTKENFVAFLLSEQQVEV